MKTQNKARNFIAISLSVSASILLVAGIVYATTIGTNISTGGSLTVSGNATFSGLGTDMIASINSSGQLVATSTPTAGFYNATSTTATSTFAGGFTAGGSSGLYVLKNGNMGIGTSSPSTPFAIAQGSGVYVNSSGNVGIGTAAPGSLSINSGAAANLMVNSTIGAVKIKSTANSTNAIDAAIEMSGSDGVGFEIDLDRRDCCGAGMGKGINFWSSSGGQVLSLNLDGQVFANSFGGSGPSSFHFYPAAASAQTFIISNGDATSAGKIGLVIQGGTSQTADIQQWQNSSGAVLSEVSASGKIGIGTTSPASELAISSTATSTLQLGTAQSTTHGSCIQMYSPNGTAYRVYISNGGTFTSESGSCK